MLAYNGLALITEKLQNQRLDEPAPSSTQPVCSGTNNNNNKLPQLTHDTSSRSTNQPQSNLAVKGKNVWALSLESERHGRHDLETPDSKPLMGSGDKLHLSSPACRHKKPRQSCVSCDSSIGTATAPPKKKHCRSLSVPPDGPALQLSPPAREAGGKIWKPVAVIPLSNNEEQGKDRNSLSACTASSSRSSSSSSAWLPRLTSGFKLVPSTPSVDSGHFTTSDLQTPPGSPIPRPASVASDTSLSSLGSAWHDYSPMRTRLRVLENRSLSLEDRISGSSSSTYSMPCVHGVDSSSPSSSSSSRCRSNSQDGSNTCSSSIPRCHSQPCVLHHRRCGKKRRRDCDRPTLNFNKMTETAYMYTRSHHRRSEPWSTPGSEQQFSLSGHPTIAAPSRPTFGLNPIASSPLDSELPVMSRHIADTDLSQAASIALPLTPPDHSSPNFPSCMDREEGEDEDEEEEEVDGRNCNCHDSRTDDGVGLFPLSDLDLEQIESH